MSKKWPDICHMDVNFIYFFSVEYKKELQFPNKY